MFVYACVQVCVGVCVCVCVCVCSRVHACVEMSHACVYPRLCVFMFVYVRINLVISLSN